MGKEGLGDAAACDAGADDCVVCELGEGGGLGLREGVRGDLPE